MSMCKSKTTKVYLSGEQLTDQIRGLERRITNLENILNVQFSQSAVTVIQHEIRAGNAEDFLAAFRQSF